MRLSSLAGLHMHFQSFICYVPGTIIVHQISPQGQRLHFGSCWNLELRLRFGKTPGTVFAIHSFINVCGDGSDIFDVDVYALS